MKIYTHKFLRLFLLQRDNLLNAFNESINIYSAIRDVELKPSIRNRPVSSYLKELVVLTNNLWQVMQMKLLVLLTKLIIKD